MWRWPILPRSHDGSPLCERSLRVEIYVATTEDLTDIPGPAPSPGTTNSPVRGPYRKGLKRRAEIISAATEIFAISGYHATSIAAVAERVGLTLPGLLHYFPTKTHLLLSVLEQRDTATVAVLPASDEDWRVRLRTYQDVVRQNESIPGIISAFTILETESLQQGHPAADWSTRRLELIHGRLVNAFETGKQNGTMRPDADTDALAREVIAMMDGLQIQWLRQNQSFSMASVFEGFIDQLIARYAA